MPLPLSSDHIKYIHQYLVKVQQLFPTQHTLESLEKICETKLNVNFKTMTESEQTTDSNKKPKLNTVCDYRSSRGKNKGKLCGKECMPNKDKCDEHVKHHGKSFDENISSVDGSKILVKKTGPNQQQLQQKQTETKKAVRSQTLQNATIIQKIISERQKFQAFLNNFGNYEHRDTHFVVDPYLAIIVGKQDHTTGKINSLSSEDVQFCKDHRLRFQMPSSFPIQDKKDELKPTTELESFDEDEINDDDFSEDEEDEV